MTAFLIGCNSADKQAEKASAELKKEIVALDSVSTELQQTKENIIEATEDLDAALEELDN